MNDVHHFNFFDTIPFSTVINDDRLKKVISTPLEISAICGHDRFLFLADRQSRLHLIGPDSLKEDARQHLLCTVQLLNGRCTVLHMEVVDVVNTDQPGQTTTLIVICAVHATAEDERFVLAYQVYRLLPPLNSRFLLSDRSLTVASTLLQPLILTREGPLSGLIDANADVSVKQSSTRSSAATVLSRLLPAVSSNALLQEEEVAARLAKVTCVAISESLDLITLGCICGEVIIFSDCLKVTQELPKHRRLVPDSNAPISALTLSCGLESRYIFIGTSLSLSCYQITKGAAPPTLSWLDTNLGCSQNCLTWIAKLAQALVATPRGLFLLDPVQGNVSALPLDGIPISLSPYGGNQAIIATFKFEASDIARQKLLTTRPIVPLLESRCECINEPVLVKIILLEPDAKFVAGTQILQSLFKVSPALGHVIVYMSNSLMKEGGEGEGCWLIQHPLARRLRSLMKRGLWRWALKLAQSEEATPELKKMVYRLYFLTSASNANEKTPNECLSIFEDSIRDASLCGVITFEDFIAVTLGNEMCCGSDAQWRLIMQCLLRTLLVFHQKGFATQWHTQLLIHTLVQLSQDEGEKHIVLVSDCEEASPLVDIVLPKELFERVAVTEHTRVALKLLKAGEEFRSKGAHFLAASFHFLNDDLREWAVAQSRISIHPILSVINRLMAENQISLALECLAKCDPLSSASLTVNEDQPSDWDLLTALHQLRRNLALSEQHYVDSFVGNWFTRILLRSSCPTRSGDSSLPKRPEEEAIWDCRPDQILEHEGALFNILVSLETWRGKGEEERRVAMLLESALGKLGRHSLEDDLFRWLIGRYRNFRESTLRNVLSLYLTRRQEALDRIFSEGDKESPPMSPTSLPPHVEMLNSFRTTFEALLSLYEDVLISLVSRPQLSRSPLPTPTQSDQLNSS